MIYLKFHLNVAGANDLRSNPAVRKKCQVIFYLLHTQQCKTGVLLLFFLQILSSVHLFQYVLLFLTPEYVTPARVWILKVINVFTHFARPIHVPQENQMQPGTPPHFFRRLLLSCNYVALTCLRTHPVIHRMSVLKKKATDLQNTVYKTYWEIRLQCH